MCSGLGGNIGGKLVNCEDVFNVVCPVMLGSVGVLNVSKHCSMLGSNFAFLIVTSLSGLAASVNELFIENLTPVFY